MSQIDERGMRDELRAIVLQTIDGSTTDDDCARLETLLQTSPSAARWYLEEFDLAGTLLWDSRHAADGALIDQLMAERATVVTLPETSHITLYRRRWWPTLTSVAAVAMLIYGGFVFLAWDLRSGKQPTFADGDNGSVAVMRDLVDVLWSKNALSKSAESSIRSGEPLKIESGIVQVELKRGVTLLVEGPAQWSVEGDNHAKLESGKIVAKVPAQAIGFTLETPTAKVVDLGTEFGVLVDAAGTTETQVFRGAIEMETLVVGTPSAPQRKQKRRLVAGEAARVEVTATVPQIQTTIAKPDQFIRQLSSPPSKPDHQPSAYARYVIEQTKPKLYWNFDNPLRSITKDLVRSQPADNFLPSAINQPGPRPTDGFALMSAGNRAASVSGGGNVSLYQLNKKLGVSIDAYSMQIWFNSSVPFGDQAHHYLLCRGNSSESGIGLRDSMIVAGNYEPQKLKTGCLTFFGNVIPGETKTFAGKTLLSPDRWYLATFVRDDDRIRVYLNGNLEIDADCPWHGGEGEYVTFGHRVDLLAGLGLKGRFDEVAIWDRALTEGEVVATYRLAIDKELSAKKQDR